MKQIVGVLLVILGVAYFTFQGFSYTSREKVLDIGPIEASEVQERQLIPYSPLLGGAIIAGGVILLVAGARGRKTI